MQLRTVWVVLFRSLGLREHLEAQTVQKTTHHVTMSHDHNLPFTEYELFSLNLKVEGIFVSDTQLCIMTFICQGWLIAHRPGSREGMPLFHAFSFSKCCTPPKASAYENVLPTFQIALPLQITLSGNSLRQIHSPRFSIQLNSGSRLTITSLVHLK